MFVGTFAQQILVGNFDFQSAGAAKQGDQGRSAMIKDPVGIHQAMQHAAAGSDFAVHTLDIADPILFRSSDVTPAEDDQIVPVMRRREQSNRVDQCTDSPQVEDRTVIDISVQTFLIF